MKSAGSVMRVASWLAVLVAMPCVANPFFTETNVPQPQATATPPPPASAPRWRVHGWLLSDAGAVVFVSTTTRATPRALMVGDELRTGLQFQGIKDALAVFVASAPPHTFAVRAGAWLP